MRIIALLVTLFYTGIVCMAVGAPTWATFLSVFAVGFVYNKLDGNENE